jgi:hypothetical protein
MPYKVIVWATGLLGSLALRLLSDDPRFEVTDAGELVGLPPIGVTATRDRETILALDNDVADLLASGKNVVSTAGFFAPEVRRGGGTTPGVCEAAPGIFEPPAFRAWRPDSLPETAVPVS